MAPAPSVVKVGGSLVSDRTRLRDVLARLAEDNDGPAVVVPGGGPFADAVRSAQISIGFDDALAHRLALDAMGRMAEVFSALEPRLRIVSDFAEVGAGSDDERAVVWDPVRLRVGHPDIPESWDVTSDSLAVWLATRLDAARCILIKSAPCPVGAQPEELVRLGLVDRAFPAFARVFEGEIVVRGHGGAPGGGADRRLLRPGARPNAPRIGLEGGREGPPPPLGVSRQARLRPAPRGDRVYRIDDGPQPRAWDAAA